MNYISNSYKDFKSILTRMKKRELLNQIVTLGFVISSALMIWKTLMFLTNCEGPIAVVLTGSMEPAFYRGDLLFLSHYENEDVPYQVGDVILFKLNDKEIPIVHRVIRAHTKRNKEFFLLTKGDNNQIDDRNLYPGKQLWLERKHILGRINGYLPYVGIITIIMNDYPILKYLVIAFLGLLVLTNKE